MCAKLCHQTVLNLNCCCCSLTPHITHRLTHQVDGLYQDGGFTWGGTFIRVWHGNVEGLATTFLEPENGHFWRGCIYGRNDDAVRWVGGVGLGGCSVMSFVCCKWSLVCWPFEPTAHVWAAFVSTPPPSQQPQPTPRLSAPQHNTSHHRMLHACTHAGLASSVGLPQSTFGCVM